MNCVSAFLVSLALVASSAYGAGIDPTGKYDLVTPPQPTDTPDKVEVLEVFWYGCPHCFTFLPYMEQYAKSAADDVAVRHMPAIFRDSWVAHARDSKEELMKFFEMYGVSNDDFNKTFNSFAVETLLRKSQVMQQRYGVRGTPTVIVNGKYRVSGSRAGQPEDMIKVIEALPHSDQAPG
jgi:thiol:disulfide interchange protein DsbA